MYAVIRTGGKQYRVQPGDLLVVEKLDGEPGAEIKFDTVLMLGDEGGAVVGAPTVKGAAVTATLVETRKGEKIKVFKKIRRQGYRRTGGHRQPESVLRVTGVSGEGKSAKWDGKVELISRAELVARARGLATPANAPAPKGKAVTPAGVDVEDVVVEGSKKSAKVKATVVEHAGPAPEAAEAKAAPKQAAAPKKAEAAKPEPKAKAAPKAEKAEAPKAAAKPKADAKAKAEPKAKAAAPKAAAPAKKPAAAKPAAPKGKKK